MKSPETLKRELSAEILKIVESAEKAQTDLAGLAAMTAKVTAEIAGMVETADAWDADQRIHGERISGTGSDGKLVDLSEDQLYVKIGGPDSGMVMVDIANSIPGTASFREATGPEIAMFTAKWIRFGEGVEEMKRVGKG